MKPIGKSALSIYPTIQIRDARLNGIDQNYFDLIIRILRLGLWYNITNLLTLALSGTSESLS